MRCAISSAAVGLALLASLYPQSAPAAVVSAVQTAGSGAYTLQIGSGAPTVDQDASGDNVPTAFSAFAFVTIGTIQQPVIVGGRFRYQNDYLAQASPPAAHPDFIHLSGYAGGQIAVPTVGEPVASSATSLSKAVFQVLAPATFHLTGMLTLTNLVSTGDGSGAARASVSLTGTGPGTLPEFTITQVNPDPLTIDETGAIQPGFYTFAALAAALGQRSAAGDAWRADANFDVTLTFSPVPAPSAALALTTLAALAPRRRRAPGTL